MADAPPNERAGQGHRAYQHYTGTVAGPLTARLNEPDDNLVISLARVIVDKGAAFLFGEDVTSQVSGPEPEPKQDWLDECWRRNKRPITLLKLATNGGIFGHVYVRLLDTAPYPRLIVLDPQTVEVVTDPDDCDTVWKFTITPPKPPATEDNDAPPQRRTVIMNPSGQAGYAVTVDSPWQILDQEFVGEAHGGGGFQTVQSTQWPYDFSPIAHCQNLPKANDFWGESDLPDDVLKILDGITKIASNYSKIIRLHAHPKVWTTGMGQRTVDFSADSIIHLPSEVAKIGIIEMQSELASTMALLEKLISLLSYMVRIPMVAMGEPDNLGSVSGVSIRIRFQPLIEKTEAKRRTYGDLLSEVDRCLLAMAAGRNFGDQTLTTINWPDLLPTNELELRQVAVLDDSLGLASKETLSERLGFEYTTEQERLASEKQDAIDNGLAPDPAALVPGQAAAGTVPAPLPLLGAKPDVNSGIVEPPG